MKEEREVSLLFSSFLFFSFLLPVPLLSLSLSPLRVEEKVEMSQKNAEKRE
jgi:hypothetical protein